MPCSRDAPSTRSTCRVAEGAALGQGIMDSITGRNSVRRLEEFREALAAAVAKGNASKAIVFGSYARGDADRHSDLDMIVIADTERTFFNRHDDFDAVFEVWPHAIDLLIYTPDEFAQMIREDNPFIERALQEGVVIYEE